MQPIKLSIKDFCGHSNTDIPFNDFSSALVIGKVKDNERFSNGAGKSTVFNAIEYVLFNEIHFSSLEKIIRDGCDVCRVEFEFTSSLDKETYKIVRSNSRKSGTDVRLFKLLNNNEWEDLTQRRVSDTEKEIVKIVGFNYKAFCASVLFNQAGSENNIQKDFGNLPSLTPEKRKSVLREVLQLNVYTNYEKLAKIKYGHIQSSLEKEKIILSTIGDPEENLNLLNKDKLELDKLLSSYKEELSAIVVENNKFKLEYNSLSTTVSDNKNKLDNIKIEIENNKNQIVKFNKSITDLKNNISHLPDQANSIKSNIDKLSSKLESLTNNKSDSNAVKNDLSKTNDNIFSIKGNIAVLEAKIKELSTPIDDNDICSKCHQSISASHRERWEKKSFEEISSLSSEKEKLYKQYNDLVMKKSSLETLINNSIILEKNINEIQSNIKYLNNDLDSKRALYKNYSSLLEEHNILLKDKQKSFKKLNKEFEKLSSSVDDKIVEKIQKIKLNIDNLSKKEAQFNNLISELIGKQAVISHKIEQCNKDKLKILSIKNNINDLERQLLIHSKVVQAFGSNGIPALITHSILDELQNEANNWLLKLRPGLQLQFIIIKDKNKKEQEDTLDILYFIDGNQREYKQLSGAQKIIVSLSLKLSLLFIMNKRLGVDIKLMLLDEVDQALDPGSTEIFADIIKIIQEELKVMVITHNDELKHKFSHAVIVEQDENNVSFGKLINW